MVFCQLFECFSCVQSMFYFSSVGFREMCKSSHEPIAPFPRSGGLLSLMQKLMRLARLCLFAEVNATCCDTGEKRALDRGRSKLYNIACCGGIAQLGERLNGIQEVSGSIPLISTILNIKPCCRWTAGLFYLLFGMCYLLIQNAAPYRQLFTSAENQLLIECRAADS